MTAEVISYLLSQENEKEYLQSQMVLQCAPFLKRIKIAGMFCAKCFDEKICVEVLNNTDICYKLLYKVQGGFQVFLYRKEEFQTYLRRTEVRKFLIAYGYDCEHMENCLNLLGMRLKCYLQKEQLFPHEIGVFLGYPPEDVKAFIKQNGKRAVLCGYWKVYSNIKKAQLQFLMYDMAKVHAVNEYLCGRSVWKIALQNNCFSWYNGEREKEELTI